MDSKEREHLHELLETKRRRLRVLEQQRAAAGPIIDPSIILQIEDLSREIADHENELNASEVGKSDSDTTDPHPTAPSSVLSPVRTYRSGLSQRWFFFVEPGNTLWLFDGRDVEIFEIGEADPIDRWHLPEIRWKTWLPRLWHGRLVYADWDGNIWLFGRHTNARGEFLYEARYSDTPFHRLAIGPQGQLAGATWDGRIFLWDASSQLRLTTSADDVPSLAVHLVALSNDRIAFTNQRGLLRVLDETGHEIWQYQASGHISDIWANHVNDDDTTFFLLLSEGRIVRVKLGQPLGAEFPLPAPALAWAHIGPEFGRDETLVALESGGWEWLSWSAFRIVTPRGMPHEFTARRCWAIRSPQAKANRIGIGIDAEGHLFATEEHTLKHFSTPPANALALDEDLRFIYLAFDDRVEVYRNPVISPPKCKLSLERVDGSLLVGQYKELHFHVRNVGDCPIGSIRAELDKEDNYVDSRDKIDRRGKLLPGELAKLTFSAKASEAGSLLVTVKVMLEDEAGPPSVDAVLKCHIDSREHS
jgi:hypothetical protein